MEAQVATLPIAAARSRPITMADTRLLEGPAALAGLFPGGGIRRGSTVVIGAEPGGSSLALALAAGATAGDGWAAAVGWPSLGLVAAAEMGVRLERLALVPYPGDHWAVVAAALVDGIDLLLLRPSGRVRSGEARRLAARARERGTVLVVIGSPWPEPADLRLAVTGLTWEGLGSGYGSLRARQVEVSVGGRRAAARERRGSFWLPGGAECQLAGC